jgi:hypothetical protein
MKYLIKFSEKALYNLVERSSSNNNKIRYLFPPFRLQLYYFSFVGHIRTSI